MSAIVIDGKKMADQILELSKDKVKKLKEERKIDPCLAIVQVGDDKASTIYVNKKLEACKKTGVESKYLHFDNDITQKELTKEIKKLNKDKKVHGIIVQLPLPKHINANDICDIVDEKKDVDGFNTYNQGRNLIERPLFIPATAKGIIHLIESVTTIEGKHAVCVGTSNIVGKPTAIMLLNKRATVTMCNIYTRDLTKHTKMAEILVVAVGKPNLITEEMIREGVIVIDVGINKLENGKIVGDVDFENIKEKAYAITPVPGGVGPMTVACLIENTICAAEIFGKNK